MKICFVVPSMSKGGMERVVSLLANNIRLHAEVHIVTLTSDVVEYPLNKDICITHLNKDAIRNRFLLVTKLVKSLKRIMPDFVVGFSETFNPITLLAAKYCRIKVFVSDRSSPLIHYSTRDKILKKSTYFLADALIAQTELAKEVLLRKGLNKNVFVLPNPVSTFNNIVIGSERKRIITVGRLIKSKNQIELIEIFHEINMKDWQLIIVGDGSERKHLERYIFENGLDDSVKLMGKMDDIESILGRASIFGFTSLSEGFPNAVLEGLCFPLATIAYDCPAGVSDLITNDINGYLIPLNDRNSYKTSLVKLMKSPEKRLLFMTESIKLRLKYSEGEISNAFLSFLKKYL